MKYYVNRSGNSNWVNEGLGAGTPGSARRDYSLLSKFTLKIHSVSSTLIFWEVTCFWEANLRGSVGNNCTERAQICSRFVKWSCVIRRTNTYLGISNTSVLVFSPRGGSVKAHSHYQVSSCISILSNNVQGLKLCAK